MKKLVVLLGLTLSIVSLAACNTISGIGKDIERGGQAIERSAR